MKYLRLNIQVHDIRLKASLFFSLLPLQVSTHKNTITESDAGFKVTQNTFHLRLAVARGLYFFEDKLAMYWTPSQPNQWTLGYVTLCFAPFSENVSISLCYLFRCPPKINNGSEPFIESPVITPGWKCLLWLRWEVLVTAYLCPDDGWWWRPIRGQYSGHVTCLDQSEARNVRRIGQSEASIQCPA